MIKAEYIDHMGDDLRVVNAARVSFDKQSEWEEVCRCGSTEPSEGSWPCTHGGCSFERLLKPADEKLIHYLARGCSSREWDELISQALLAGDGDGEIVPILQEVRRMPTHWTPFAHCQITLRETVPIFVARQRFKHQVGFVYNEVSRRYVDSEPEFYIPKGWRGRNPDAKQGSSDEIVMTEDIAGFEDYCQFAKDYYRDLLDSGVCPEQARMVLPQSMMTSYYVTGSLYAFANAYNQRSSAHAQAEIRELADHWKRIIEPLYPVSWRALTSKEEYE